MRERPEQDRRSLVLRLSPQGEELLAGTEARIMERLSPLLDIPDEDIEHMLKVHQQMIQILKKICEEK
jgi:DNA-binding MarR family transcriptional regulator